MPRNAPDACCRASSSSMGAISDRAIFSANAFTLCAAVKRALAPRFCQPAPLIVSDQEKVVQLTRRWLGGGSAAAATAEAAAAMRSH